MYMITKVCKDFKFLESIAKESFTEKVSLEEKPEGTGTERG